jgi:hypothetical protein
MNKSIVCTYPDFRTLPKGLKQMLVVSENLFFDEVHTASVKTDGLEAGNRHLWQPPLKPFYGYDRLAA